MIDSVSLEQLQSIAADKPLLIFGAGAVGELLVHMFKDAGIPLAGFLDNNSGMAGKSRAGVQIYPAEAVLEQFKDYPVVVSAADIGDIVDQLQLLGCQSIYPAGPLLRSVDFSQYSLTVSAGFIEYTGTSCTLCHDAYLSRDKLFLRSVDIVITERCSLKCRDCSNLMQYYEHPQNCDLDEIRHSISALCAVADGINEFRVIGGEPFMNRDIGLILDQLIAEDKARKIIIYTNGTIIPREELIPRLANPKVLMLITDYGPLSPRMERLLDCLNSNGIAYFRRPAENWTDCSRIEQHGRSEAENLQVFQECCCKNLFTLMSGKLYRCPFAANTDRLQAVPDMPENYVNVLAPQSGASLKAAVKAFVFERKTLSMCDYCDGRPLSAPQITPAIQVKQPLTFFKYVRDAEPVER